MENLDLIRLDDFCTHYEVEQTFVISLHEAGLVHVTTVEATHFLPAEELADLEKYVRWHYDMDINLEGIEVISRLLERMKQLQLQISRLQRNLV